MYKTSEIKFQQKNNKLKDDSAKIVTDFLFQLFKPKSVVDIGCGTGLLLKHFRNKGCEILGYEGKWINTELIEENISNNMVKIIDFENLEKNNIVKHDLCLCLEVAEHVSSKQAENFVKFISQHSNLLIFSAAIPNQGGVNHINEQWSDYWDSKFLKLGYVKYDILRPILWSQENITWPHKQNMVVYLHEIESDLSRILKLMPSNNLTNPIHFENYLNKTRKYYSIINYNESIFFYLRLLLKRILK
jgi:SAM-dependent methyltransferase